MLEKYIKSDRQRYIIKRLIKTIPVLILATLIAFLVMRVGDVDPALVHLGRGASPEVLQEFRERHGLDQPLYMHYRNWIRGLFRGDLGTSIRWGQPIGELISRRVGVTAQLMGLALTISIVFGIVSGVISALYHNTWIDYLITIQALVWRSSPDFFLGIIFILIFGLELGIFPVGGYGGIYWLILPAFAMGLRMQAIIARLTRSSMLSVLNKEYIKTAKTKGLRRHIVIIKHGLRNALIPVVTVIAMRVPWLFSGAMVTEQVFNIHGMGRFILQGALARDFIVVQSSILLITFLAVIANLIADISYTYVDPRIELQTKIDEEEAQ